MIRRPFVLEVHFSFDFDCFQLRWHPMLSAVCLRQNEARAERERSLAEGEGFEPPIPFRVQRFSRPPPSTTRPSLRRRARDASLYYRIRSPSTLMRDASVVGFIPSSTAAPRGPKMRPDVCVNALAMVSRSSARRSSRVTIGGRAGAVSSLVGANAAWTGLGDLPCSPTSARRAAV